MAMAIKTASGMPAIAGVGAGGSIPRPGRVAFWLSSALAVIAAASALATFLLPGILRGPAVMNGSCGTALIIVLMAAPVLVCSLVWRGGARPAVLAWLGAARILVYNALMFLFATPVNRLFPLYLAMFSLSCWSIATAAVVTTGDRVLIQCDRIRSSSSRPGRLPGLPPSRLVSV
jgi:hypothetical protein